MHPCYAPADLSPPEPVGRRSPARSALLSLLWPGLGHAYVGRPAVAAAFAIPAILIAALIATRFLGGIEQTAASLLTPAVALSVLGLLTLFGIWHLVAIADAYSQTGSRRARRSRPAVVALVVAIGAVVLLHGVGDYYVWAFYDAGNRIFVPDPSQSTADASPGPTSPTASGDYVAPVVTPAPDSRVNILLTGVDSGHDREHALTDTLLVMSVDPIGKTVALLSIPRDIAQFPMYSGGTFPSKINSLMSFARQNPAKYPDGPMGTLAQEIGYLIGEPIHYTAAINLDGFERMINLVGGVDVNVQRAISDPVYDWFNNTYGFYLSAGPHHLDGRTALAFVRSRYGAGDNDFTRAGRQQQLLVALRAKMTDPANIVKLPDILDAAAKTITTNFPVDQVSDFLTLAKEIPEDSIDRYVLGPPYAVHPPTESTGGEYILKFDPSALAALSIKIFGEHSRYYDPSAPSPSLASPKPS
jgi:LCP family protein required for cell wall assembly